MKHLSMPGKPRYLPLLAHAVNRRLPREESKPVRGKPSQKFFPGTNNFEYEFISNSRKVLKQICEISANAGGRQHSGVDRNYPLHFPFFTGNSSLTQFWFSKVKKNSQLAAVVCVLYIEFTNLLLLHQGKQP